jgi:NAD(P)H-flavin reductase
VTVAPFGRRLGEVVGVEKLGAYVLVSAADLTGPDPEPGQFYMLAAEAGWGGEDGRPYLPRAFSFARARPARGGGLVLQFLLEAVGPGTARLGAVEKGERLWLTGPLGIGFSPPERGRPLLVAGGIGAAPILCWQDQMEARVLLGFRSGAHAEAAKLFPEALVATDDGSVGRRALVTELLREELDSDPQAVVYACGPPPMLEAVRALCAERDVPAQLALESGMACGFGACMGCVVPTKNGYVRLCVDGPVLDAAQLEVVEAH